MGRLGAIQEQSHCEYMYILKYVSTVAIWNSVCLVKGLYRQSDRKNQLPDKHISS